VVPAHTPVAPAPLPSAHAVAALALPPPRRSAAPARLLHCARRCRALAPSAPPVATHNAVLCQHGWRRGLLWRAGDGSPGRQLAAAGGAGSPGHGLPRRAVLDPPSGGTNEARRGGSGTKEGQQRDKEGEATGLGGATGLYTVVLNGPVGLLGRRASPWAVTSCRLISCRAGSALWAENEAQPSPTSCSCRLGPEKIVLGSCSCQAKISCYGLAHGPRAKWPSIPV
jgi:hypothetical protein